MGFHLLSLHLAGMGAMAKSKNHTNHNQIYKNHRNGIKKTRRPKKMSMKGMNCRFVRNQSYAKKGMDKEGDDKEERAKAQQEAQKKLEAKKGDDKAKRLKELVAEQQAAMVKKASKK